MVMPMYPDCWIVFDDLPAVRNPLSKHFVGYCLDMRYHVTWLIIHCLGDKMSNIFTLSADGSTSTVRCTGTIYAVQATGTWGGGTLTIEEEGQADAALGSESLTADGTINIQVPYGAQVKATLAGSTSPTLAVHIKKIS